jgi:2-dehydro-3-deoxygluconokinase
MLRLAPEGYRRFVQADSFEASYGGGEANVAVSLANFGIESRYVTKLPSNELGQAALNSLRHFGVDTRFISRGGKRLGIYFVEKGASQRPSKVLYDRAGSAIAESELSDFDWDSIFNDKVQWFHWTGITPAISDKAALLCEAACKKAKEKGITISCDLNYRKNLWPREKAKEVMTALCKYVDLCFANEEDAKDVFGISGKSFEDVAAQMAGQFGFSTVAITNRQSLSANDNGWSAMLYQNAGDGAKAYWSKKYDIHIVDRVGAGDSFAAGIIYGRLQEWEAQKTLDFALAASCLKHSIEGDYNMVSLAEVLALAEGAGTGRIMR